MKKAKKSEILWELFKSTFKLSAFTFGGGYVIISLMKEKFVDELGWIDEDEMLDLVAIAQSSPGAIAVNGSIVIGYKLAGLPGILVSVIATILPPFIVISLIYHFYQHFRANQWIDYLMNGMQAGVAAVIASVTFDMGISVIKQKDNILNTIMVVAFILNYFFEVNVVYIILACLLIGYIRARFIIKNSPEIGGD